MSDLFISYSRQDIAFTRKLFDRLGEFGLDLWIDWEDIPPGQDWMDDIFQAIEEADNFLFLISQQSISSRTCSLELEHAQANNKRLIPVIIENIDPASLPEYLRALNWIFFRPEDDFDHSIELLQEAINLDQAHARAHTNYQMRALSWERSGKEADALLRGTDLQLAETWLAPAFEKEPPPSLTQQEYLSASRSHQIQRQRRTFTIMGGAFLLMLVLSIFAFFQRGIAQEQSLFQATAEAVAVQESYLQATAAAAALDDRNARATSEGQSREQRDIAYSQQLALQAVNLDAGQLDLRLLLSAQAASFSNTTAAQSSLLNALNQQPHLACFLSGNPEIRVESARFSMDGDYLALGTDQGTIALYNPESCALVAEYHTDSDEKIEQLLFSRDSQHLVAVSRQGIMYLWNLNTNQAEIRDLDTRPLWKTLLAISPDASLLAVQGDDRTIRIVSALTGDVRLTLQDSATSNPAADFKPDGTTLAVLDGGIELKYWDLETGEPIPDIFTIQEPEEAQEPFRLSLNNPYSIIYSPDGNSIAFISGRGTYLISDGMWFKTPDAYEVGFDSQGEALGFGSSIFQLIEWDLRSITFTGGPIYSDAVSGDLQGFAWSPIGHLYLQVNTWGNGSHAVLYDFSHESNFATMIHTDHIILSSVFANLDGKLTLITGGCRERASGGCVRGEILFWDPDTGEQIGEPIDTPTTRVDHLSIHPSQELLASEEVDARIRFWQLPSGEPLQTPIDIGNPAYVDQIGFNADGSLFAAKTKTESSPYSLSIWSTETWEPVFNRLSMEAEDYRIHTSVFHFLPGTSELITLQGADALYLWNLSEENPNQPDLLMESDVSISSFAVSPAGDRLVIVTDDGLDVYTYPSLDLTTQWTNESPNKLLFFSPSFNSDGTLLAGQIASNNILLFDGRTGETLGLPLEGHTDENQMDYYHSEIIMPGNTLSFSQNGHLLASTYIHGEIIFWEIGADNWIASACRIANRSLTEIEWRRYLGDLPYAPACSSSQ